MAKEEGYDKEGRVVTEGDYYFGKLAEFAMKNCTFYPFYRILILPFDLRVYKQLAVLRVVDFLSKFVYYVFNVFLNITLQDCLSLGYSI